MKYNQITAEIKNHRQRSRHTKWPMWRRRVLEYAITEQLKRNAEPT